MKHFPKIKQFRDVIREVRTNHDYKGKDADGNPIYSHDTPYPTLSFTGRVKLHGTNAAVVRYADGTTKYQSRERELSLTSDNAGFMLAMSGKNLEFLFDGIKFNDHIAVFGEWAGLGIQKGVAVAQLPRSFYIFNYMVDGVFYNASELTGVLARDEQQRIFDIDIFPVYHIDIDFNNPEASQNTLIDWTLEVEKQCPVGAYFDVNGIGEGLVLTCDSDPNIRFKSKGELHSTSRVKVLNAVDVEEINSINEFVEYAVTENRLQQGLDVLKSTVRNPTQKETALFLKWVVTDIMKEEMDTIVKNQIDPKKANGFISRKAKEWYFSKI